MRRNKVKSELNFTSQTMNSETRRNTVEFDFYLENMVNYIIKAREIK